MYSYCLFCLTNKCDALAGELASHLSCTAIYPKQICHRRINGKVSEVSSAIFPGYLFLYSEGSPLEPSRMMRDGVIRILTNSDSSLALRGTDEAFAMMIFRQNGIFGRAEVSKVGSEIRLREGAFAGLPARILRVDRRYTRMQVEVMLVDKPVKVWMEYQCE